MMDEMPKELTESDVSELLAKRRRRVVLRTLRESATPLTTIELAERIGEREDDLSSSAGDLRKIHLDLYHNHLPKLEDAGVVTYDENDGTVAPGPNFEEALRDTNPRRIEVFIRTSTPSVVSERLEAVLDRLNQLRDDGFIADYRVRQWPPRGSASVDADASTASPVTRQEIISEFDAWAERHGYTLQPAFQRQLDALPESEGETSYTVPLLTLAFYEDETLTGVIPCADGQYTYTIADFLSAPDSTDWIDLSDRGEEYG